MARDGQIAISPQHPAGVLGGQLQCPRAGLGEAHDHGAGGAGGVEHRQGVPHLHVVV